MGRKTFWILIFVMAMLTSCAYYNTFYNAEMYYERGVKDYKESLEKNNTNFSKKNFNLAIEKSEKVLANYPDSKWCDDAQYLIAVSNYYKANYRKSKKEIENFFEEYPSSELGNEMNMWYGRVFWKMGSPEMAIHHWKQMVVDTKDNELKANIYFSIAEVFEDIEKPDSAIFYYDKTTKVKGGSDKHGQAQYNIAELYLKMNNMEKAIENIEKVGQFAVETDLKQKRQVLLLKIYRTAGQYEKAEKLIHKKLNDEKNKEIWDELELELGLLYRDIGDTSAALTRLKTITENDQYKKTESAAAAFYYMGMINLVDVHDYKKAEQNFALVQKENNASEFVFDANQRTKQLKRFDKIEQELLKNQKIVNQVLQDLNSPEEEIVEVDTVDKSQDEIKQDLEAAEKEVNVANIDTLKTFDDYYKSRYELAEIYYFDFNFKDSAKIILDNIVHSPYFNPYIEQSLYALYYINKLEKNDDAANFYLNELRAKNSESPFISFVETGKIVTKEKYEKEKEIFNQAEDLIDTDPDKAIEIFKILIDNYPENPYQGKSAANIAWIMENQKYDLDNSLLWYKTVIDSFPSDATVPLAKERYQLLSELLVSEEKPADTLAIETTTTMIDSSTKIEVDSTITKNEDKVRDEIIDVLKKEPVEKENVHSDSLQSIIKRDEKTNNKGTKTNNEKDLPIKNIEK